LSEVPQLLKFAERATNILKQVHSKLNKPRSLSQKQIQAKAKSQFSLLYKK
jgi:hypothetical protein